MRRLGWGFFTLEAKIVLKEPYSWVVDNSGAMQSDLDLTWTLDFEGRGRQGRVRAKVKKLENSPIRPGRTLRPRAQPVNSSYTDDEDEEDEDYDDSEDDDENVLSDVEDEDAVSEDIGTPQR